MTSKQFFLNPTLSFKFTTFIPPQQSQLQYKPTERNYVELTPSFPLFNILLSLTTHPSLLPIKLHQAFSMGCACRSPPILFGMKSKTEGNTLEFPLSARVSLLERNLKNGILFRLLPLKHSAVPPFSLEALMCKETIHNHLDSAILLIKYHPIL